MGRLRLMLVMMTLTLKWDTNVLELSNQQYGTVQGAFAILALNPEYSLDDTLPQGAKIVVDETLKPEKFFETIQAKPVITPKLIVVDNQGLFDLCMQYYGTLDALFLAQSDFGLDTIDRDPVKGFVLNKKPTPMAQRIVNYYQRKGIIVATQGNAKKGGIGFMRIGTDFIVS